MCSPSNNSKWSDCYMGNALTEGVRGSEGVLRGWKEWESKTEMELFVSLFWAPLPLLRLSIYSPPSSKCWGCRWPSEESTYQSPTGHVPIWMPIYSSAHLMTIHPVRFTLLLTLPSIFQIICPSTDPSVHPSSNSSTHPFISPSFIHLSSIYPSIYPHTGLLPSVSGGTNGC